ncbi:MAG: XdhC family protein [Candidatus Omnitrophica bacterium]|nr:XdhC family protein [Candidatus Omnitrophota bacterium]
MDPIIRKAFDATQKGQSFAFATIIEATTKGTPRKAGAKMAVLADGQIVGSIGGGRNEKAAIAECRKAIKNGQATTVTYNYFGNEGESVCGGQMKVFIEPFAGRYHLIICGAGHIALPLSFLGKLLNFQLTIIDNRKEFANKKRFPHADKIIVTDHAKGLKLQKIDDKTCIVIVTQGNELDYECLKVAIKHDMAYLGVISSKAKRIKFFNRLKKDGISEKLFSKITIPTGLDIGAQTPEEIAISIAAEIIKISNQDLLKSAKFVEKSKH